MAFFYDQICEHELKNNSMYSLELFPFVKQLAELIEEHIDLGPSMD